MFVCMYVFIYTYVFVHYVERSIMYNVVAKWLRWQSMNQLVVELISY